MVRVVLLLVVSFICFAFPIPLCAGIFQKTQDPPQAQQEEINVLDSVDKLIVKRRAEARKLIKEGEDLIKKGEKRNDQRLVTKGQIKKEIGEKQLAVLKEQAESKEVQDKEDGW